MNEPAEFWIFHRKMGYYPFTGTSTISFETLGEALKAVETFRSLGAHVAGQLGILCACPGDVLKGDRLVGVFEILINLN